MKNLSYSLRHLLKARGGNITRIVSLSLGLLTGIMIFSYVNFQLTFNRDFPDKERIWQMFVFYNATGLYGPSSNLTAPIAPAMAQEISPIESATRFESRNSYYIYNDNRYRLIGVAADTSFFDILDYGIVTGNPKDILSNPDNVLLSESAAKKLFGESDPLGKIINFEKQNGSLIVAGIFKDPPVNNTLGELEIILPLVRYNPGKDFDGSDMYETYIKLRKGANIEDVEKLLPSFWERHNYVSEMEQYKQHFYFLPITTSYLEDNIIKYIAYMLSGLAILTLFVSCMNYVLISISAMVDRSKTIGMLKCGGAMKSDIFRMFLYETLIITFTSLIIAVLLIVSFKNPLEQVMGYRLEDIFALKRIWSPLVVILAVFLMGGIIPARLFSSIPVSVAFKGASDSHKLWKKLLLFIQITSTAFVVIMLIVIFMQYNKLLNGDKGYEHDKLAYTHITLNKKERSTLMEEIGKLPQVKGTAIGRLPIWFYSGTPLQDINTDDLMFSCRFDYIDENYFPLMGMQITKGENFNYDTPGNEIIVNEEFVRRTKWTDSPVGKNVKFASDKIFTISGVVKNFIINADMASVLPMVFYNQNYWAYNDSIPLSSTILIKLKEISPENIEAVKHLINKFNNITNTMITSFDTSLDNALRYERSYKNTILTVALFILIIVLIGLTGYISDEVRRRRKEVAIRRVNGAQFKDIVRLFFGNFAWILIPAIIIGITLGYAAARYWLTAYNSRIALSWWIFAAGAFAVITVVYLVIITLIRRFLMLRISG